MNRGRPANAVWSANAPWIAIAGWILIALTRANLPDPVAFAGAPATLPSEAAEVVASVCLSCHDSDTRQGDLDLQGIDWDLRDASNRRRWVRIHDRVRDGEMPPDQADLPVTERTRFLNTLAGPIHDADLADVRDVGRGQMRRLTRGEFEADLRDLLKLPNLDVKDYLPEDREANQNNRTASTLDITRVQLNAYLTATSIALREAIASGLEPSQPRFYRALATNMFPKAVDHAGRESSFFAHDSKMVPLTSSDLKKLRNQEPHDERFEVAIFRSAAWPYYGYPNDFVADQAGEYRVRLFARAVNQIRDFRLIPSQTTHPMTFRARKPTLADVSGDVRATGGIIDVVPEGSTYETMVYLKQGETIEYSLLGLPVPHPITSHGGPLYYDFPPMPERGHRGIAFRWIEIEGPIDSTQWPPASHRVLFDDLPIKKADPNQSSLAIDVVPSDADKDVDRLLRRFTKQASMHPVAGETLTPYRQLIHDELASGSSFAEAMLVGYQAWLCSGHFLFLRDPTAGDDSIAVANRLSHFLWNCRPDHRLRVSAEAGQLGTAGQLRVETDRLIDDPRFNDFVANFTDHWLDLKNLGRDAPDIRLYPEYRGDDYLVDSAGRETPAFISHVIRENLPITTLVDSEFAMINDRLARHYQLPSVQGSSLRKVTLPSGSRRGGLLTQAAVAKVTANGTTTSPILRGAWVMDRIFGTPPPPPPPGVPSVEPDLRGATTIRELLDAHSKDAVCAACHRRFDPVGLAMENLDILGGWRDRYRSLEKGDEITGIDRAGHRYAYHVSSAVDSSGQLDDGTSFEGIAELKQILASDARQLARNYLVRLVAYSTGTSMRFSDRRVVESILDACEPSGFRARDLLHGLVQSRIFLGENGVLKSQLQVSDVRKSDVQVSDVRKSEVPENQLRESQP